MKKMLFLCIALSLMVAHSAMALNTSTFTTIYASGPNGPAPNSGDGIPDGSGNDAPFGPNK